jgi:hypothetical protein
VHGKTIDAVLKTAGDVAEALDYFSMAQAPDGSDLVYVDSGATPSAATTCPAATSRAK